MDTTLIACIPGIDIDSVARQVGFQIVAQRLRAERRLSIRRRISLWTQPPAVSCPEQAPPDAVRLRRHRECS